jgi:hypothetical protein
VAQDRFKDLKATFTADGKWITHLPDGDREGTFLQAPPLGRCG